MAAGVTSLRKVQMGWEVTPGTGVAATFIWRGTSNGIKDDRVIKKIDEQIGIIGGTNRTVEVSRLSGLVLEDTPCTFEQFPVLLAIALGGPTTGVQDGVGSDYIYTTNLPENSIPTPKTVTVEAGNNAEEHEFEYGHILEFKLSGAMNDVVNMGATLRGQVVAASTFTGALLPIAVTEAVTSLGKVYIDVIGGTYGSTQVSNLIIAFDLAVKLMYVAKQSMDGSLDFSLLKFTGCEITGSLTFENDTGSFLASGPQADFAAQTPKKLQIKLESAAAVTTPGTTYSKKTIIANLPIKYESVDPLASVDGNDVVKVNFFSKYDVTAADAGQFIVVNELTALP